MNIQRTMATYFHGSSEIQGTGSDGLQTLILMNPPGYVGFSDTHPPPPQPPPPGSGTNFVFLNSHNHGGNPVSLLHAPPSHTTQQFVGIPITFPSAASPQDSSQPQQDFSSLHAFLPRVRYNDYSQSVDFGVAREVSRSQQGLSLSLSSQQSAYGSFQQESEAPSHRPLVTGIEDVRVSGASSSPASGTSGYANGVHSVLLSSRYLKVAQELLDEVVNVEKGLKSGSNSDKVDDGLPKFTGGSSETAAAGDNESRKENGGKREGELTAPVKQEIQMRKAKLASMLHEVEQRYRQYHHQMQIVISWFEQAAGIGSAKTYTALALQTISKQFRCLKDAILGQMHAASKSLGEEDSSGGKIEGSRFKFVDNQIRQQKALQQLGIIQHTAWRPQRGLPEGAVSVLRAWLFEHFLHPYPKESDKLMLAKQTGLTRSQVSNWFINARVRLWKPMIEEMYTEEMKEQPKNEPEEKSGKNEQNDEDSAPKSTALSKKTSDLENQSKAHISSQEDALNGSLASPVSVSPTGLHIQNQCGFNLVRSPDIHGICQGSPKKARNGIMLHSPVTPPHIPMDAKHTDYDTENLSMKFGIERQSREGFSSLGGSTNSIDGFSSYPIAELGRLSAEQFQPPYSGNGFSLTLGLPHCENITMSLPHQPFLTNQSIQLAQGVEMGDTNEYGQMNTESSSHSTNVYETIDIQDRKRFAVQLLPDYVA